MDGFTYHNIFETKGIEYIVIIAFLLLLIPFWMLINKKVNVGVRIKAAIGALTSDILRIPQGLFYSKNHAWAYLEKSGNARIGLDDFLLQVVGDVKVRPLKSTGESIVKGDKVAEIEHQGKRLSIISPVSGEVIGMNELVTEVSGVINNDPYNEGWIYSVKPTNWKADTSSYFLAEEASKWIGKELLRFKDFLSVTLAKYSGEPSLIALQEGGELRRNVLAELDENVWKDFQDSFLT